MSDQIIVHSNDNVNVITKDVTFYNYDCSDKCGEGELGLEFWESINANRLIKDIPNEIDDDVYNRKNFILKRVTDKKRFPIKEIRVTTYDKYGYGIESNYLLKDGELFNDIKLKIEYGEPFSIILNYIIDMKHEAILDKLHRYSIDEIVCDNKHSIDEITRDNCKELDVIETYIEAQSVEESIEKAIDELGELVKSEDEVEYTVDVKPDLESNPPVCECCNDWLSVDGFEMNSLNDLINVFKYNFGPNIQDWVGRSLECDMSGEKVLRCRHEQSSKFASTEVYTIVKIESDCSMGGELEFKCCIYLKQIVLEAKKNQKKIYAEPFEVKKEVQYTKVH